MAVRGDGAGVGAVPIAQEDLLALLTDILIQEGDANTPSCEEVVSGTVRSRDVRQLVCHDKLAMVHARVRDWLTLVGCGGNDNQQE